MSRHGVRAPIPGAAELANWAAQPWPTWNEPPAELTPRGAQLATLLGRYYRQYLGEQSVVMAAGCPARESVYVYADTMHRTKATAQALKENLRPTSSANTTPRPAAAGELTGALQRDFAKQRGSQSAARRELEALAVVTPMRSR